MSDTMDNKEPITIQIDDISEIGEMPVKNIGDDVQSQGESVSDYEDDDVESKGESVSDYESDVEEKNEDSEEDEPEKSDKEPEQEDEDAESQISDEGSVNEDGELSESEEPATKTNKMVTEILGQEEDLGDDEDSDEDSDEEDYLIKFNKDIKRDHILQNHPELIQSNYDEITALCKVVRDEQGIVIDPLHKTLPTLTKYEYTRVLGLRAKQINSGAEPLIEIPDNVIEGYVIAQMELAQKALPYIIVRPLPGGKKEYWHLRDLEIIDY